MRGRKILTIAVSILLSAFILTGCDFGHVALLDSAHNAENERTRKTVYWSGTSVNKFTIGEGESTDIVFQINNEKGSVTFSISDSEGNEVYTLAKNEAGNTTDTFTAESAGTYTLTEKADKFSGDYAINWGDYQEETE